MKKDSWPAIFFAAVLSLLAFYFVNRFTGVYLSIDGDVITKLTKSLDLVIPALKSDPVSFDPDKTSLIAGLIGLIGVWLVYVYNFFGRKNYMHGIEHGSAHWGGPGDISNFTDIAFNQNILLTETERLSMSNRMKRTKEDDFNRNKNVLVIGGSGSGKTRFYIKPNLMQLHSSYVITDPKGSLIHECGALLRDNNYRIKVFDLISRTNTDRYNPFAYIRNEDDILKLINNLIANTNPPGSKSAGDFWEKSEAALLSAIFGYIHFVYEKKEDKNIAKALDLLRLAEVRENDPTFKSKLDELFDELRTDNTSIGDGSEIPAPEEKDAHTTEKSNDQDSFAVRQYDIFKLGAGKTAKGILISAGVRLAPFNIPSIRDMVSEDTLELDTIGDQKTALFILLPDTDKSFNFIAAMMYQQLFDVLVRKADSSEGARLPVHVRFLLDEFANIGQIPGFDVLISTLRSREISVNIVLQNLAQIKNLYRDTWEIITGNCDSLLFLGGMEQSTLEYISKMCGKTTIDNRNTSESRGQTGSYTISNQILGRDLITPDEVGGMRGRECILKIRGCNPFRSMKYDIEKHQNYKYLSDADKSNRYVYKIAKEAVVNEACNS